MCYHDINTVWPVKIEVTVQSSKTKIHHFESATGDCERTLNFCLYIPEMQTCCYIWYVEWAVLLAVRPFNSFNTEENRAPLANRAAENRAVNLDCGGKWTDRSGGVSSVCEQRCISVDTPRHFCVLSNLTEKMTSSAWSRYSFWICSRLICHQNVQNVSWYKEDANGNVQSCTSWDKGIIQM